ncbi:MULTISPECIES: maleylpyruvate isomerase N-terminal domain-containing protein [unclassified Mycobacterium]|uniref:maleylpyruvate isomerase N-terminal domain-containing protein n=1 Tax=unclassified Mycobacterium TaxID=2642494 RepID=UPI000898B7D3|nr:MULTISPECIES: maleylpyruvate isomerase N-terminal domain-containing protein [unclassified Mycobacterium]SEB24492.1 TIGR03083 family protein [Mycobacterium sp. 283mftsu]
MSGIDLAGTREALRAAASRTSALVRSVSDPAAPVPNLSWTVAETAAHLVTGLQHYAGLVTGETDIQEYLALAPPRATPTERGVIANARMLEEFTERDPRRLADLLISAAENFIAVSDRRPTDEPIPAFNGLAMTVPVMASAMLGEQLLHGLDMARAVGGDWTISRAEALHVIAGVMAMIPDYVDRQKAAGLHLAYELRFRDGPRYRVTIEDGSAAVGPAGGAVDCWISADPVAYLLVGYGRTSQWASILQGKILSAGRKPWLGAKLGQLFVKV